MHTVGKPQKEIGNKQHDHIPPQTGTLEDVLETKTGFLEQAPPALPALLGLPGRRDVHQHQHADGEHKRDDINPQDAIQTNMGKQGTRQQRSHHPRSSLDKGHHPVSPAILLLGHHGGDGGGIGGPLERIPQPNNGIHKIKMPDFQVAGGEQKQDGKRPQPGSQVADRHHQLAVVTVHHHACQRNDQQVGQGKRGLHDTKRSGAAGLLENPNGQSKTGHAGGKNGNRLTE